MNHYLLDTNVVSELRKPRPNSGVVTWIGNQKEEQLLISAVTLGEVQAGIERLSQHDSRKAEEIERWLDLLTDSYQVLPMDSACFREWGRLTWRKSDQLLEDAMIAATAKVHGLIVVTRNQKDFGQFGLNCVNPFSTP